MKIKLISIIFSIFIFSFFKANAASLISDFALTPNTSKLEDDLIRIVEIDSDFQGASVLLYGVKKEAGDIVVVVRGPKQNFIVRQKERIAGVWLNRRAEKFDDMDDFYMVASGKNLKDLASSEILDYLELTPINDYIAKGSIYRIEFLDALHDYQKKNGRYSSKLTEVSYVGDALFRAVFHFPDNIQGGVYTAEVYLFRNGQLKAIQTSPLLVRKKGMSAFISDFANQYSFFYGIFAVILALAFGWLAGIIFKK